jgi:hypothetical protein
MIMKEHVYFYCAKNNDGIVFSNVFTIRGKKINSNTIKELYKIVRDMFVKLNESEKSTITSLSYLGEYEEGEYENEN